MVGLSMLGALLVITVFAVGIYHIIKFAQSKKGIKDDSEEN